MHFLSNIAFFWGIYVKFLWGGYIITLHQLYICTFEPKPHDLSCQQFSNVDWQKFHRTTCRAGWFLVGKKSSESPWGCIETIVNHGILKDKLPISNGLKGFMGGKWRMKIMNNRNSRKSHDKKNMKIEKTTNRTGNKSMTLLRLPLHNRPSNVS